MTCSTLYGKCFLRWKAYFQQETIKNKTKGIENISSPIGVIALFIYKLAAMWHKI